MRVAIAHPGTQHAFRLAIELDRQGHDVTLFTGVAFREGGLFSRLGKIAPRQIGKFVASQTFRGGRSVKLRTRIFPSVLALIAAKSGDEEALFRRNASFQRAIAKSLLRKVPDVVIGFDTSSHLLAQLCEHHGVPFVLDQTIAPFTVKQEMMRVIAHGPVDWRETVPSKSLRELENEAMELKLATRVVAPSGFTRDGLIAAGGDPAKIAVIPFGVDATRFKKNSVREADGIRYLFVGSISARKGVPTLLEAWRLARGEGRELVIVGELSPEMRAKLPQFSDVKFTGRVANAEVASLMADADVFVFPSLCEGLALVLLEALASGLPLIATRASGASDLIDGRGCGKIVLTNDPAALAAAMRSYAEDRDLLRSEASRCIAIAGEFSWERYGLRWDELIRNLGRVTSSNAAHDEF